jgi:hypothetical protein
MASLCFRRPSGQHFLVFFDSISQAIVHVSKIQVPGFELTEPLDTFLSIGPDQERFVGSSNNIQLILTVGHVGPHTDGSSIGDRWPEHFIVIDKNHIHDYLAWDQIYGWPQNAFAHLGPFSAVLEPFVGAISPERRPNYFVLSQSHYTKNFA